MNALFGDELKLEEEQFLIEQAPARHVYLFDALWEMDCTVGLIAGTKPIAFAQRERQGIIEAAHFLERVSDHALHDRRAELIDRSVEGLDDAMRLPCFFKMGENGVRHTLEPIVEFDRTRYAHQVVLMQLIRKPRLIEAGHDERARAVEKRDLKDVQIATRLLHLRFIDARNERARKPDGRLRDSDHLGHVEIATRKPIEQVAYHFDPAHC